MAENREPNYDSIRGETDAVKATGAAARGTDELLPVISYLARCLGEAVNLIEGVLADDNRVNDYWLAYLHTVSRSLADHCQQIREKRGNA